MALRLDVVTSLDVLKQPAMYRTATTGLNHRKWKWKDSVLAKPSADRSDLVTMVAPRSMGTRDDDVAELVVPASFHIVSGKVG